MSRYEELLAKADMLIREGHPEDALSIYKEAIEVEPQKVSAYYNMAILLFNLGLTDQSIVTFEKILEIEPGDDSLFNNLGTLYFSKGMWAEAEKNFTNALALNAQYIESAYGLAIVYLKQNKKKEAIHALKKCAFIDPTFKSVTEMLKQELLDLIKLNGKECSSSGNRYTFMHVSWDNTSFVEMTPAVIVAFDILSRNNNEFSLVVYSRRMLRDYPWEIIDMVGNNKKLVFRELKEDIIDYRTGEIFLYPAVTDAFRLKVAKVLSLGIPAIAMAQFYDGVVQHGFNGILIQGTKNKSNEYLQCQVPINELAKKMYCLAKDPELISEMAVNALGA